MSARTICSIACVAVMVAASPALAAARFDPARNFAGSQSASQAPASSDSTLGAQIADSIRKDSSLNKYDLKVTVNHGVATITGAVRTDADRGKASQLATITGITRIDNQVVVDPSAKIDRKGTTGAIERKTKQGVDRTKEGAGKVADKTKEGAGAVADKSKEGATVVADKSKEGATVVADKSKEGAEKTKEVAKEGAEKTKEGAEKVYDKSKEGAETVADKTKQGVSKTGEVIADTYITSRVKTEFIGRDALKDSDIKVETNDHVVTLSGTVMTQAGRDKAIELAKTVDGVRSVVDHMTIGPKNK
ncbi:MAG TPA: BON domain-containing protein [Vicinamibacterales bacterium]|jgi:hyperosmotically inducible protein|nr:BON domain-containing protein [Vicinamibacterales bacterium]